tara:strand:+ start:1067 stop:1720 length:654 start_codon:yes stop_codon:yes gene_type:complete
MATRALIGYLNNDNTITTTYNHYDGYPENLGVALDKHYNTDAKAKEIANMGYVSFIDPETGDIEANNSDSPVTVGDEDLISSIQFFKDEAKGVDYVYLFSPSVMGGEWIPAKTSLKMDAWVDTFLDQIADAPVEDDMMDESYQSKWKNFLNEDMPSIESKLMKLQNALEREPAENVEMYLASVERDLKRGDKEQYENMTIEDMIEDYNVYIDDRMDS